MAVVLGEPTGGDRNIRAASLLEHGFQQYGWKQMFNQATIDNLPVPADARGPQSVRSTILSWDCGNGKRNPAVAARKDRIKAAKAKREKAKHSGVQAKAEPTGGSATAKSTGSNPVKTPKAEGQGGGTSANVTRLKDKASSGGTSGASANVKQAPAPAPAEAAAGGAP